jgi:membrane-associated phospholipid phosphatase
VDRRRRDPAVDDGWTSEASSGFALAGFLSLVFGGLTLLAIGPLSRFDTYFNLAPPPASWLPFLHVLDRTGQRGICVPILAVVAYVICRRIHSWRPALVAAVAVFALNLVVLILKVGLGRDEPHSADPSFFSGGMAYPSGHSSNVVLVYGLISYLVMRYGNPGRRMRVFLWALVPVLSVVMVFTSMTLNWHWFTDLVSGLVVGAVILQLAASVDRVAPDTELGFGWQGVREIARAIVREVARVARVVRAGRSDGPADPV